MDGREINKFLDAAAEACCKMDFRTFGETVSWFAYDPLIAKSWTKRILKMIDDCREAGLSSKETADLFPNMSELRFKMILDLWMTKYADISRGERKKIFDFYSRLLMTRCLEDPYAHFKNIIHTRKEIEKLLTEVRSANPKIAKNLGRLVSACYHLGHAMYSDMYPSVVYENYGPYDVSKKFGSGHMMAIKEFGNLRCKELWPESIILPCDFIRIIYIYRNVKMTVDAASHAVYQGDLINDLKYFGLKVDRRRYPEKDLEKISEAIEKMAILIFQKFQSFDFETRKEKYYFFKAYVYKKIYEKLGQDWRPSKEIINEARGKYLYQINWPKEKEKQKELVRKTLDPRIDFKV